MKIEPKPEVAVTIELQPGDAVKVQPQPGDAVKVQPKTGCVVKFKTEPGAAASLQPAGQNNTVQAKRKMGMTSLVVLYHRNLKGTQRA